MRYHALAAPLTTINFEEDKASAKWTIEPNMPALADPALYRFVVEMQIGIHISLMRDIMGPGFAPSEIRLAYPQSSDFCLPPDQIGCPVRFNQPEQPDRLQGAMAGSQRRSGQQNDIPDHRSVVR